MPGHICSSAGHRLSVRGHNRQKCPQLCFNNKGADFFIFLTLNFFSSRKWALTIPATLIAQMASGSPIRRQSPFYLSFPFCVFSSSFLGAIQLQFGPERVCPGDFLVRTSSMVNSSDETLCRKAAKAERLLEKHVPGSCGTDAPCS